MSEKVTEKALELVRQWAADGVDLNGIQKRLQTECGVHLTYMDVRFLLLDHGIEIATEQPQPDSPEPNEADTPEPIPASSSTGVHVALDDLQLPGTLLSGKASFPGGAHGAWQIDQLGRFGWSELSGQPSPEEMRDFQQELTTLLSRG